MINPKRAAIMVIIAVVTGIDTTKFVNLSLKSFALFKAKMTRTSMPTNIEK